MKKSHDRAYWQDVLNAHFIEKGFGRFDEAIDSLASKFPEFRDFYEDSAREKATEKAKQQVRTDFTNYLRSRYREVHRQEHVAPPATPPHIRQQFIPLHIDVPPMSPTVSAFDGQGVLSMAEATPKQHRRHHRELKKYHQRGGAYHEGAEHQWDSTIEVLKLRLASAGIELPENLPLREILEQLKHIVDESDAPDDQAAAPTSAL
jgi:hypothetical protein